MAALGALGGDVSVVDVWGLIPVLAGAYGVVLGAVVLVPGGGYSLTVGGVGIGPGVWSLRWASSRGATREPDD